MEENLDLTFRLANQDDLTDIIQLLSDDALGSQREKVEIPIAENYVKAFRRIQQDSNQELTVVELNGTIVGTFQLTFIQYLTHQGSLRAQIEAVRVDSAHRGKGIGKTVFQYAINRAKEKGCSLLQLTTDKQRPEAIRFYKTLGFAATHEGLKLKLKDSVVPSYPDRRST